MIEGIESKRRVEIPNANGSTLVKIILKSQKCNKNSDLANDILNKVWLALHRSPNLYLMPEAVGFDSLTVKHDGDSWILTFQVVTQP
jgi:hypothetical protein